MSVTATVHQQLAKSLTHPGLNLLRPTLVRSQTPGAATQAQQLRAQKLSFVSSCCLDQGSHLCEKTAFFYAKKEQATQI